MWQVTQRAVELTAEELRLSDGTRLARVAALRDKEAIAAVPAAGGVTKDQAVADSPGQQRGQGQRRDMLHGHADHVASAHQAEVHQRQTEQHCQEQHRTAQHQQKFDRVAWVQRLSSRVA